MSRSLQVGTPAWPQSRGRLRRARSRRLWNGASTSMAMWKIDWDFTKGNSGARPPRARHHNHLPVFFALRKDKPMDLLTIGKNAADRVEAASVANRVPV